MLALLGSRTGEAGPPSGPPRATGISKEMTGSSLYSQGMPGGAIANRNAGQGAASDSSCRIRLLAVAAKPAVFAFFTIRNDVRIPWDRSPDRGHLQRLIGQLGSALPRVIALAGHLCSQDTKGIEWPERIALSDGRFLTGKPHVNITRFCQTG